MDYTRVIKVFLASPMDLLEERSRFMQILQQINETLGTKLHLQYQVVSWERDVLPDKGDDAQDVVNAQIELDYDVFACFFRDRVGTPTKRAASGTVEEYQRALAYRCTNPELRFMLYFLKTPEESREICRLKEQIQRDGLLYMEPDSRESFERMLHRHFSNLLMDLFKKLNAEKDAVSPWKREAAVAAALTTPDGRLLLVQRAASSKFAPYLWQLPGGKAEPGEPPVDALVRELREELSLQVSKEAVKQLQVFQSTFLNDKTRTLDMYLFLCPLQTQPQICLNEESQAYEWIDLAAPALSGKQLLGLHREMVQVVWQELGVFSLVEQVLEYCRQLDTDMLPSALPGVARERLHSLYAMLSALGFVTLEENPQLVSSYSLKLLEALLRMSRSGTVLFDDGKADPAASLNLLPHDFALLRQHRDRTLYSHSSLLAMMSCKTSLPNSTRYVNNVLIFGENRGQLYILLRWDFFSKKFQMLASGVKKPETLTPEDMARKTLTKRFDEMTFRLCNYLPIKEYTTRHFAAGSVDNDPILRRYIIYPVAATVRKDCREDFLETVRRTNTLTQLTLEYSFSITREQSKQMQYFAWCAVEELLKDRDTYRGLPLQGFAEMLSNIGQGELMLFARNPVPLQDADVEDALTPLLRKYDI